MSDFEERFNLTDESRSPELKEPMRIAYEAGVAKAKAGGEFARLGEAISDAINRLPKGYTLSIDLAKDAWQAYTHNPDCSTILFGQSQSELADEITKAVDAAIEDSKRRVSDDRRDEV